MTTAREYRELSIQQLAQAAHGPAAAVSAFEADQGSLEVEVDEQFMDSKRKALEELE